MFDNLRTRGFSNLDLEVDRMSDWRKLDRIAELQRALAELQKAIIDRQTSVGVGSRTRLSVEINDVNDAWREVHSEVISDERD
jgi:hypothetical protein